jgi:hypothetical protein
LIQAVYFKKKKFHLIGGLYAIFKIIKPTGVFKECTAIQESSNNLIEGRMHNLNFDLHNNVEGWRSCWRSGSGLRPPPWTTVT